MSSVGRGTKHLEFFHPKAKNWHGEVLAKVPFCNPTINTFAGGFSVISIRVVRATLAKEIDARPRGGNRQTAKRFSIGSAFIGQFYSLCVVEYF